MQFKSLELLNLAQSATEQRPHKVSFYVKKDKAEIVIKSLYDTLTNRGVRLKLTFFFPSIVWKHKSNN